MRKMKLNNKIHKTMQYMKNTIYIDGAPHSSRS